MAFYRYLLEKDITAFSNKPQQLFNATQKWVRQHIPSANGSLASSTVIHLEGAVEAAKGWNGIYGECYKENVTPQDWKKEIEEYNRLSKGPTTSSAPKLKENKKPATAITATVHPMKAAFYPPRKTGNGHC